MNENNETKQTEMSKLGADKGLLQDHARKQMVCAPLNPEFLWGFQQTIFKCKVREGLL